MLPDRLSRLSLVPVAGWLPAFAETVRAQAFERIDAELTHDVREIDHHVIIDDLAILDLPKTHIADLDLFSGGLNTHESAGMPGPLMAERRHPFPLCDPGLFKAGFVRKTELERTLPAINPGGLIQLGGDRLFDQLACAVVKDLGKWIGRKPDRSASWVMVVSDMWHIPFSAEN